MLFDAEGSLLVRITSMGFEDPLPPAFGSRYTAQAITINGIACATGNRGHNVVVVDLHLGIIHDSVSFDTWGDPTSGENLKDYLGGLEGEGRYLVCIAVLDSGGIHIGAAGDALKAWGGSGKATKLEHRDAYALVGCRKGGKPVAWVTEKFTSKGWGPARCVMEVPLESLNKGKISLARALGRAGAMNLIVMLFLCRGR